jgi:hypothetical protein
MEELSTEIDRQLHLLTRSEEYGISRFDEKGQPEFPLPQMEKIREVTGEAAREFLKRFVKAARNDLCDEGGVLYAQWKKWGDLTNKNILKSFGALLVGMGFSGSQLQVLAVALAVVVIHLGVRAVCQEAEEPAEGGGA